MNHIDIIRAQYKKEQQEQQKHLIEVGTQDKRKVSKLNHELFIMGKKIFMNNGYYHNIGWRGFGNFIDWLEQNYDIKKKED